MNLFAVTGINMIASPTPIEEAVTQSNRVFAIYLFVLVVSGLVIALFTWLTWKASNRVQDVMQKDANARTQEAQATSAQANEKATSLANLNLVLQGQLNSQYKEVAHLQIDVANAKKQQEGVEIELAKQQERAANAERSLKELSTRDRLIKELTVTLSVSRPGWQPESHDSYLATTTSDLVPDRRGDPWQTLTCGERRIHLRPIHRHTISQGLPRKGDASHTDEVTLEPIERDEIIGRDIKTLDGCTGLLASLVSLYSFFGPLARLNVIHATAQINGISLPFLDAILRHPNAEMPDKEFVQWIFSDTGSSVSDSYLRIGGSH